MSTSPYETDDTELFTELAERQQVINTALDDRYATRETALSDAEYHLIEAGGKRLRPAMSLLVAEALVEATPETLDYRAVPDDTGTPIDVLAAAESVELLHTFTLVHDDIMDDDAMRRGADAVHTAYGQDMAILTGDSLYAEAFSALLESNAPANRCQDAMELLVTTAAEVCEGQAMDISFEDRDDVTPDEYLEMSKYKTAVLYGAAAAIPAILLGAADETVDSLYEYGVTVGRAFQIQDDVLDLTTSSDELGKQRGSDLIEDKQTLITLHAREQGVAVNDLIEATDPEAVTDDEIAAAVEQLEEVGSIEYARTQATEFVETGKQQLRVLPESAARGLLATVAEYLVDRAY